MCRVHLCNRKAVPNSNLCDGHYRQLVDRALSSSPRVDSHHAHSLGDERGVPSITESEARVMDGNR